MWEMRLLACLLLGARVRSGLGEGDHVCGGRSPSA